MTCTKTEFKKQAEKTAAQTAAGDDQALGQAEHAPSSAGVPAASLQNVKKTPPQGFPCGGHVFAQRADFICSKAMIEYIYYLFPDSMKTKQSEPRAIQDSDRSGRLIFFV